MTTRPPRRTVVSALVSDVDGTLVTKAKVLTPATIAAVEALRRAGILFAITSARPPLGLRMLIEPLGIDTVVSAFNGAMILSPDMHLHAQHPLGPDVARAAVERLLAHGVSVWVFTPDAWLVLDANGPYVGHEEHTVEFAPTVVADFSPFLFEVGKIVGVSQDFARLAEVERELAVALGSEAEVRRSQSYYLDITHPRANKGDALVAIADVLGVPIAEIAAIGDGLNDIAMFRKAGLSICMANGPEEARASADVVTSSNEEDGFAKAVSALLEARVDAGEGA